MGNWGVEICCYVERIFRKGPCSVGRQSATGALRDGTRSMAYLPHCGQIPKGTMEKSIERSLAPSMEQDIDDHYPVLGISWDWMRDSRNEW